MPAALGPIFLACLVAGGCTICQDVQDAWKYRYTRPDSLAVLKDEKSNGNDRAWALRYMSEPLQHHGTQEQQDLYVKILGGIAVADRDPLCRLQAVRMLGTYKDPRAVKALQEAYFSAKAFPAEMETNIHKEVLIALGQTGDPAARELLIQVARDSAKRENQEAQLHTLDERLCAVKGLGHFKQSDATETLHQVLTREKDIALRDVAYVSLQEATGLHLPPDPAKWDKALHGTPMERDEVVRESSSIFNLVGWWH
jgi:HEAT repeat protein